MIPLCVVLLSGGLPDNAAETASEALKNRGFEVFAERALAGLARGLAPEAFHSGGRVLIAFNALMSESSPRRGKAFAEVEVEKAVHLLATALANAPDHLRVAEDARLAEILARDLLSPEEFERLEALIGERRAEMSCDLPVLADLSRFKYRAKVELVEWNGQKAVKKTFRRTAMDAMERELAFCDDIAPRSGVPPRILDRTENAIVFECIDNTLKIRRLLGFRLPIPLPLSKVRKMADFVRLAVARGWDPIDLTPRDNILIDGSTGALRAIDFEFAHRRETPVRAEESFFLSGVPEAATVARPLNQAMSEDPYPSKWRPFTGLSKHSFLHNPAWMQMIERVLVHPIWLTVRSAGAILRRRRHAAARDDLLDAVVLRYR
ncbi:MAG: hypothetical protein QNJ44_05530 [Rhodobacter sp.]|nr:hypothetical protein [Rhodobacter sp.]